MKFALGRTSQSQQPVAAAPGSAASTALQQSSRQQQQARQLQALKHGNAALIQHKPDESMVSQQAALEDEEPMQGKFETAQQQLDEEVPLQGKFEPSAVNQRQADAAPANNTGMPDQLKSGIESLSGYAMDDVKVHYNSAKPAQMQAHAYAQGSDIHIAPGQEQHLPHEAWHVVQQKQGRVKATTQLKGEAINDDPGLEHEADVMGARALVAQQAAVKTGALVKKVSAPKQRMKKRLGRDLTAEEMETARTQGIANSDKLTGHGRKAHGKRVNVPDEVLEQQTQQRRQEAVDAIVQLKSNDD